VLYGGQVGQHGASYNALNLAPMKPRRFPRSPNTDKGPFIASRLPIRNRFHRWDCPWVAEMELKNRLMFKTHADAVASGRKPCLTCRA
jgi:hypothetical protein